VSNCPSLLRSMRQLAPIYYRCRSPWLGNSTWQAGECSQARAMQQQNNFTGINTGFRQTTLRIPSMGVLEKRKGVGWRPIRSNFGTMSVAGFPEGLGGRDDLAHKAQCRRKLCTRCIWIAKRGAWCRRFTWLEESGKM